MLPTQVKINWCQWGRAVRQSAEDAPCPTLAECHLHLVMAQVESGQIAATCLDLCQDHATVAEIASKMNQPLQFNGIGRDHGV